MAPCFIWTQQLLLLVMTRIAGNHLPLMPTALPGWSPWPLPPVIPTHTCTNLPVAKMVCSSVEHTILAVDGGTERSPDTSDSAGRPYGSAGCSCETSFSQLQLHPPDGAQSHNLRCSGGVSWTKPLQTPSIVHMSLLPVQLGQSSESRLGHRCFLFQLLGI
jgi:hypothetical protein